MKIKQIFDEISSEPGTNKKMDILQSHKDGPHGDLLKRVLYLANSKRVKFYIKQIPDYKANGKNLPLKDAIEMLSVFTDTAAHKPLRGAGATAHLEQILSSVSKEDAYIIERIIEKDCKLGMGTTNINKIYGELIENTPYMGAKAYSAKLAQAIFADPKNKGYAYSQIKMDGRYMNAIIRDGDVEAESRGGEPTVVDGAEFLRELKTFPDCVLNGELTIDGVSRYDSNGIIASLISINTKKNAGENVLGEIADFEKKRKMTYRDALNAIRFTVWDVITVDEYFDEESSTPYHDRLVNLSHLLDPKFSGKPKPKMVSFIKTKKVYSFEDAMTHFQEMLAEGQEGTILKASNGTWEDNKPNWQVKMKLELDVDLKIVGFNYGTGKNASVISSVTAESSDGLVSTRPTGIKEDMMKYITANQAKLMGAVLEVKCSGLSHDSKGDYALLHPVFKCIRDDKKTYDSLQSIKDIEAAAKSLTNKSVKPVK
jgi:hypothetical protein